MDKTLNADIVVNSTRYRAGTIPPKWVQEALQHRDIWEARTPRVTPTESRLEASRGEPVLSEPEDGTAKELSARLGGQHPKSETAQRAKLFDRAVKNGLVLDGRNVD